MVFSGLIFFGILAAIGVESRLGAAFASDPVVHLVRGRPQLSVVVQDCSLRIHGSTADRLRWEVLPSAYSLSDPLHSRKPGVIAPARPPDTSHKSSAKITFREEEGELDLTIRGEGIGAVSKTSPPSVPSAPAGAPNTSLSGMSKREDCRVDLAVPRGIRLRVLGKNRVLLSLSDFRGQATFRLHEGEISLSDVRSSAQSPLGIFCLNCVLNGDSMGGAVDVNVSAGKVRFADSDFDRLTLSSDEAPVEIARVRGNIHVQTRNGPIRADEISGEFSFISGSGSVAFNSARDLRTLLGFTETGAQNISINAVKLSDSVLQARKGDIQLELPSDFDSSVQIKAPAEGASFQVATTQSRWRSPQSSTNIPNVPGVGGYATWSNSRARGTLDLEVSLESGKLKFFEKK